VYRFPGFQLETFARQIGDARLYNIAAAINLNGYHAIFAGGDTGNMAFEDVKCAQAFGFCRGKHDVTRRYQHACRGAGCSSFCWNLQERRAEPYGSKPVPFIEAFDVSRKDAARFSSLKMCAEIRP
jgi:hypothetical protein